MFRSSFQLIDENSGVSGDRVTRLKQFIVKKYLINLPGYGTVILRSNKEWFEVAVKTLERYVLRFQQPLKKKLQEAIDTNREVLIRALLPSVAQNPPIRWKRFLGSIRGIWRSNTLRSELADAFGDSDGVFQDMNVKAVFKGLTYELLSDLDFMRVAGRAIPLLDTLHDRFEAAKAEQEPERKATLSWNSRTYNAKSRYPTKCGLLPRSAFLDSFRSPTTCPEFL